LKKTTLGNNSPEWRWRGVIFCTSFATLLFEVILTRVLSVTMWCHFAFMVISLAMLGLTAGALLVFLAPQFFTTEKMERRIGVFSFLFSVAIVLAFLMHLSIPFMTPRSLPAAFSLGFNCCIITVPFIFSGTLITLLLTRTSAETGALYAFDLLGAALAPIAFVLLLGYFDAASTIFVSAIVALVPVFLVRKHTKALTAFASIAIACFVILICFNGYRNARGRTLFPILFAKSGLTTPNIYEEWNSFSRIAIADPLIKDPQPFGWGYGDSIPSFHAPKQLTLTIDASAATVLTNFNGNFDSVAYLFL
jgi:hypothetical protein